MPQSARAISGIRRAPARHVLAKRTSFGRLGIAWPPASAELESFLRKGVVLCGQVSSALPLQFTVIPIVSPL